MGLSEQGRVIFTKEELAARVKVPAIVEQDLKRIISDRLEQCGLYYRVFSRTKTAASMAHKFELKDYGEDNKKLQDLIGVLHRDQTDVHHGGNRPLGRELALVGDGARDNVASDFFVDGKIFFHVDLIL